MTGQASSGAAPMLVLDDVTAGYGDFQALFGVSLDVKAGEAVAVIGPNGAGKSTLMRAISGMILLKGGTVVMEGQRLSEVAPHKIVEMGIAMCRKTGGCFPVCRSRKTCASGRLRRHSGRNMPTDWSSSIRCSLA